jgi:hypothetical protein
MENKINLLTFQSFRGISDLLISNQSMWCGFAPFDCILKNKTPHGNKKNQFYA